VFEGDEDKTRRGRLLNAVLLLDTAGMALMLTTDIISGNLPLLILGLEVAAIFILLGLRIPMYQGRITQASYGPVLLFLILTTGAVYFLGTTRDPTLGAFILLVVTAGLLLDRRAIFITTAACILAVSIMMIAEGSGRLPEADLRITLSQWGTITVLLIVSAYLTLWARESIERALTVARKELAERKRAEDGLQASLHEKEILLQEIHHRVKNNMQVISSILSLQSRHLADPAAIEMFKECQHRIRTMALVHESLYKSTDLSKIEFSAYLKSLASNLLHFNSVDVRRIRLETELEKAYLDIQTAIPAGLIANELLSNAMKHAFPGSRSGTIALAFRPLPEGGYLLSIKDDGIGFPKNIDYRKTDSLGLQIVSSLIDQVDGRLEIHRENGTEFRVVFRPPLYPRRGSAREM
jgi:two-component sensor histidine kinase